MIQSIQFEPIFLISDNSLNCFCSRFEFINIRSNRTKTNFVLFLALSKLLKTLTSVMENSIDFKRWIKISLSLSVLFVLLFESNSFKPSLTPLLKVFTYNIIVLDSRMNQNQKPQDQKVVVFK